MKYYSYVIPRDYGFAPNPYFEYCTLATCKPRIRSTAQVDDWIAAFGPSNTEYSRKLIMLMKVNETLTFDEYWDDPRFLKKRPCFNRGMFNAYGDNIYHQIDDKWIQEPSHHSQVDGSTNFANLANDTQTNRVLVATEYYYFGSNAIDIPSELDLLIGRGRNHRVSYETNKILELIEFIRSNYEIGIHGTPYSRKNGEFAHYRGE